MKRTRNGLTLIEILTAVSVIAILIGLLLPATTAVRRMAKEAKQRAQFTAIDLALETFKNDFGQYPASNPSPPGMSTSYCGAQKLTEALMGFDLLGYHPASDLSLETTDGLSQLHLDLYTQLTLPQRQGLYLASDRVDAVQVGWDGVDYFGLYNTQTSQPLAPGAHVLCDIYRQSDIVLRDGNKIKVGAPILYYRANPSSRSIRITDPQVSGYDDLIYNFRDNTVLVQIRAINSKSDPRRPFLDGSPANNNALEFFYGSDTQVIGNPDTFGYIQDPTVTAQAWPYNPDTYILISAGQDGIYGTKDDIRNFGN